MISRRAVLRGAGGLAVLSRTAATAGIAAASSPVTVNGWGGCDLEHQWPTDLLRLQLHVTGATLAIDRITLFGKDFSVVGPHRLRAATGERAYVVTDSGVSYEPGRLVIRPDETGAMEISGARLNPPTGQAFAPIVLHEAGGSHTVYASARGFRPPDYAAERAYAERMMAALLRLSDYLDTRMTDTGWLIGASWGTPEEEPQGIAGIATGYIRLHQLTRDPGHARRARRALDWLVANQQPSGAYGFPWVWGIGTGHAYVPAHFANGHDHPPGTPYAIITINSGIALLTGFAEYGDRRYLAAARNVARYLLTGETGFHWLDAKRSRGSIPYCTYTPMLPDNSPLVAAHDVLPESRNTSVETYNIDAFGLQFFQTLRHITGDPRLWPYEQGLVHNLLHRIQPDGSIDYAWYEPDQPDYYTYAVAAGLIRQGSARHRPNLLEAGRRLLTWRDNAYHPSLIISVPEAIGPLRLDNTTIALDYLASTLASQLADGSFTGGAATRSDADKLNALSAMLLAMAEGDRE